VCDCPITRRLRPIRKLRAAPSGRAVPHPRRPAPHDCWL